MPNKSTSRMRLFTKNSFRSHYRKYRKKKEKTRKLSVLIRMKIGFTVAFTSFGRLKIENSYFSGTMK